MTTSGQLLGILLKENRVGGGSVENLVGKIDETSAVIIEIDTVRSDQICKKFVSRQALSGNMNTIYIVLTYPNKNCMPRYDRNALPKYGNYLKFLTNLLEAGSNFEKLFYIHNL